MTLTDRKGAPQLAAALSSAGAAVERLVAHVERLGAEAQDEKSRMEKEADEFRKSRAAAAERAQERDWMMTSLQSECDQAKQRAQEEKARAQDLREQLCLANERLDFLQMPLRHQHLPTLEASNKMEARLDETGVEAVEEGEASEREAGGPGRLDQETAEGAPPRQPAAARDAASQAGHVSQDAPGSPQAVTASMSLCSDSSVAASAEPGSMLRQAGGFSGRHASKAEVKRRRLLNDIFPDLFEAEAREDGNGPDSSRSPPCKTSPAAECEGEDAS